MMTKLLNRWSVFFATVLVHGAATRGHFAQAPDTIFYVQLLQSRAAATFNLRGLSWMKSVFLVLLAAARALSPDHWMAIMVALNVLCSGVIAVLLFDLAQRAGRSAAAPVTAFVLYLGCFEIIQWIHFVLTDVLYNAIAFVPFYLVARRILIDGERRHSVLLVLSLLLAAFTRQPGVVLVPLVLFGELVLVGRQVRPKVAAALIVLAAVAALAVRTAVVDDPGRWPFRFIKPKIAEFSGREKGGEVIQDRRESFRPPPRGPMDHLLIVADRFGRVFQITTSGFSRAHNLINVLYFVPLYGLGAIAVWDAFRRDDRKRRRLVIAALMWIGVFAFLYGLTMLDFDWRVRTPLLPHLILLAACGADALAMRWRVRRAALPRPA